MVRVISSLSGTVDTETIVQLTVISFGFLIITFNPPNEIMERIVVRLIESVDGGDQLLGRISGFRDGYYCWIFTRTSMFSA